MHMRQEGMHTDHCTVSFSMMDRDLNCSLTVNMFCINAVKRKSFKDYKAVNEVSVWISYWRRSS